MIEKYTNKMIERVVEKFKALFGEPSRETKYVSEWKIRPNYEIAVENVVPSTRANVWVPYNVKKQQFPSIAEYYPAGRGRHSNLHSCPSLAQ